MDRFIVSARKYRPQTFDTVVGQKHITTTLKNAIQNNQLAHAYLFCGPRGVGKTTCARIFAKTINCEHPTADGEACDQCASCKSFNEGTSLNISELDAASNNSVDDIRSLVEQVRFAPQAGKYKVYIIDEVHMLSQAAFNAFLKTLEEPPSYVVFILATTEKHKLLPTILSRCQIFDFKRITNDDTVEHLEEICTKEKVQAEKAALQIIAQKSEGCMRDALSIMDKIVSFTEGQLTFQNTLENLNILDYDYFFRLLQSILSQDLASAFLLYDEINKKGFEGDIFLNGLEEFFRNLLVAQSPKAAALMEIVDGLGDKYNAAAKAVDSSFLISALNILNEAEINFKVARNKRLHVEMALIKLTYLQQAITVTADNNQVVKKKRIDGPIAWHKKELEKYDFAEPTNGLPSTPPPAATLIIQKEKRPAATANELPAAAPPATVENKTVPAAPPVANPAQPTAPKPLKHFGKKIALNSLLQSVNKNIEAEPEPEDLNPEKLQHFWKQYAQKLQEEQKHSLANTFKSAQLSIQSATDFTVKVFALVQQKFVEQEKMLVADYIQQAFHNRQIAFNVEVEESNAAPERPYLNSAQRFELMAEKFPLLKKLKTEGRMNIEF